MEEYQRRMEACFQKNGELGWWFQLPFLPYSNHGSVENYSKLKDTNIEDTAIFHWTMIMGGRVYTYRFLMFAPNCGND